MIVPENLKRIVIKMGTSTLTHRTGLINIRRVESIIRIISDIKNSGIEIIIVTSGAIGIGAGKLKLSKKPDDMPTKQAAAAIGQSELMYMYDKSFMTYGHLVAQVLLTPDVVNTRIKRRNVHNTFERLLQLSVIPIVNENDSICTDEIEEVGKFGDNDTLSATVAILCDADLLVILSDIDGLFDKDPNVHDDAKIIPVVHEIDDYIRSLCGGSSSNQGTGGMITKIMAAELCIAEEIPMVIVNGEHPNVLYDVIEGKQRGTLFINQP